MATNLQFIKSVSGASTSSSLSITDVFSEKYDVYLVTYECVTNTSSPKGVNLRLINSSDTIITNSNYDYAILQQYTHQSFVVHQDTNQTNFPALLHYADLPPEGSKGKFEVYNPFSSSEYTYITQQGVGAHNGQEAAFKGIAVLTETTSCTGFNVYLSSTELDVGTEFNVYGVK